MTRIRGFESRRKYVCISKPFCLFPLSMFCLVVVKFWFNRPWVFFFSFSSGHAIQIFAITYSQKILKRKVILAWWDFIVQNQTEEPGEMMGDLSR